MFFYVYFLFFQSMGIQPDNMFIHIYKGDGVMLKHKNYFLLIIALTILLLSACNAPQNTEDALEEVTTSSEDTNLSEENQTGSEPSQSDGSFDTIRLYLSADQSISKSSGRSIEQGITAALAEVDYKIHNQKIEVVLLDHKGSSQRAKQHLDTFIEDRQALLLFTGLHSPPVLDNRDFINENGILTLDPWAAAGPITRYPSENNWIFRLSVDDTKAGEFISDYALSEGFSSPYLILEDTGWGTSNQKTMTSALAKSEIVPAGIAWFNWSLGINQAKLILREAHESGADVIFFVGNAPEGKVFAEAMTLIDEHKRLPIRSHWGITGGDFQEVISADMRALLDLKFLQTKFSFLNIEGHTIAGQVLENTYLLYPGEVEKPEDIQAPTGFIHAYDLTKLMIKAMESVDSDLSIPLKRNELRKSLENISEPVEGLIKTYNKPFSVYSENNIDAHEALNINDFRMAYYNEDNSIILVE